MAPVVLALTLVIQIGMAAMVFYGETGVHPDRITALGAYFCRPEREVPMFLAMCAGAVVLAPIMRLFFNSTWFAKRFAPVAAHRPRVSAYSMSLCLASFVLYVPLLVAVKADPFLLHEGNLAGFLNAIVSPALVLAFMWSTARRVGARCRSIYESVMAGCVPFFLLAAVYAPNWRILAGTGLTKDWLLYHINYFLMHPLLSVTHLAKGESFYAQYGIGYPLLFARCFPEHLTYARFIGICVVIGAVYTLAFHGFVRRACGSPAFAFLGTGLWLLSNAGFLAWNYPQRQPIRYVFDIVVFAFLLIYLRSGKRAWLLLAYAAAGAALLFVTEIGLFLLSVLVCVHLMRFLSEWRKGAPVASIAQTPAIGLAAFAISATSVLLLLSPYFPPDRTLVASAFRGIVDAAGGTGLAAYAMHNAPPSAVVCFLAVTFFYLACFVQGLHDTWKSRAGWRTLLRMGLALYGLELSLVFVSQSLFTTTLFHFSHPAFALIAMQLTWSLRAAGKNTAAARRPRFAIGREIVALALAVCVLLGLACVPGYNGVLRPKHLVWADYTTPELPDRIEGVARIEFEREVNIYGKVCDIATWYATVAKKDFCALAPIDTSLYFVLNIKPWYEYPYYYYCMREKDRDAVMNAVRTRRPGVVLIQTRNFPEKEDSPYVTTADTVKMFREMLETGGYHIDKTQGPFEFWVLR